MELADFHNDVLWAILDLCDIKSFVAASLAGHGWAVRCLGYLSARRLFTGRGVDWRLMLVAAYTCSCGRVNWGIRHGCDCWNVCCYCARRAPSDFIDTDPPTPKCKYGCISLSCGFCRDRSNLADMVTGKCSPIYIKDNSWMICDKCKRQVRYTILKKESARDFFAWKMIKLRTMGHTDVCVALSYSEYNESANEPYRWALLNVLRQHDPDNPLVPLLE